MANDDETAMLGHEPRLMISVDAEVMFKLWQTAQTYATLMGGDPILDDTIGIPLDDVPKYIIEYLEGSM